MYPSEELLWIPLDGRVILSFEGYHHLNRTDFLFKWEAAQFKKTKSFFSISFLVYEILIAVICS